MVPAPAAGPEADRNTDSEMLLVISGQMQLFAEGLATATRMCEATNSSLAANLDKTTLAIAESKASAIAAGKEATAVLQRQIATRAPAPSLINPGNDAQLVWNCTILNIFTETLICLESDDYIGAKEHVHSGIKAIMERE